MDINNPFSQNLIMTTTNLSHLELHLFKALRITDRRMVLPALLGRRPPEHLSCGGQATK